MSASTERKNRAAAKAAGTDKKTNAALEAEQKARKTKRKWIIGTVAVVLCIALVLFLSSPLMYRITTAVSVGDKNYSPAEYNYYKANARSRLASYFDQETIRSLDDSVLASIVNPELIENAALLNYAKENGISLSAQEKAELAKNIKAEMGMLKDGAKMYGASPSSYMSAVFGPGVNEATLRSCMEDDLLAQKAYFSKYCALTYSAEDLASFYEDPADADVFSYATYLVSAQEGADPAEAKTAADALVMSFTDGYDGETDLVEAFNALLAEDFPEAKATERADIRGSNLEADLRDWLTAEERQAGDITAVEAENGWTVVLFQDRSANDAPTVTVRHILIQAEVNEEGVYTDEAKAAAKARADEILNAFNQGDKSEASFAALAYLLTEDSGSRSSGGLYTVTEDSAYVEEFKNFAMGEHQKGDTAVVYGESAAYAGYHIMFYVDQLPARDVVAREGRRSADMQQWSSTIAEGLEPVAHWASKW